ncbi:putative transcription factor B3-Domain family [Helianthus anomalus]
MDGQKLLQILVWRTQILYFLTLLLITKFEIFHFKVDHDLDVKNMFYHIMLFSSSEMVPIKFTEHNFNDDILQNNVTIRYGPNEWTVKINKLWNIHYYILDFSQISADISFLMWDCLVFEKVEDYTFNLIISRPYDVDALVADLARTFREYQPIALPMYLSIIVTKKFSMAWCFPTFFVTNVPLHDVHHMTVQTNDGSSILMKLRSKYAHGKPRYAFKGWQRFMRGVNGDLSSR